MEAPKALVSPVERSASVPEAHSAEERLGSEAEAAQDAALSAGATGQTPKADEVAKVVPR